MSAITKPGKMTITEAGVTVDGFTIDCGGIRRSEAWVAGVLMAWAAQRIAEALESPISLDGSCIVEPSPLLAITGERIENTTTDGMSLAHLLREFGATNNSPSAK